MKKLTIISAIAIILLGLSVLFLVKNRGEKNINNSLPATLTPIVSQLLEENQGAISENDVPQLTEEQVYKNPFIRHIRVAFDSYFKGLDTGIGKEAIEGLSDMPNCGMNKFDKSYYKSKFIVWDSEPSIYGGMVVDIVFIDKLDTIFWTWVYQYDNGDYALMALCENGPKAELKDEFVEIMKAMIKDGKFSYSL